MIPCIIKVMAHIVLEAVGAKCDCIIFSSSIEVDPLISLFILSAQLSFLFCN